MPRTILLENVTLISFAENDAEDTAADIITDGLSNLGYDVRSIDLNLSAFHCVDRNRTDFVA